MSGLLFGVGPGDRMGAGRRIKFTWAAAYQLVICRRWLLRVIRAQRLHHSLVLGLKLRLGKVCEKCEQEKTRKGAIRQEGESKREY